MKIKYASYPYRRRGGKCGIRTHGGLSPITSFQDWLLKPLGQLARFGGLIVSHPWLCYTKNYKRKLPSSSATHCLLQSRLSTHTALKSFLCDASMANLHR